MSKVLNTLLKLCIFSCFFISQILFFTDLTKNPYLVQLVISAIMGLGGSLILAVEMLKKEKSFFLFYKADTFLLCFLSIAIISLGINCFTSPIPQTLLNDFWRVGYIIITALFGGYLLARLFCHKDSFLKIDMTDDNYKNGLIFFVWGLLWLPFSFFRTNGLITVYGIFMWATAIYLGLRFLKEITLKNALDIMLVAAALSSAYAIFQNLGYEFIWYFNIGKEFGSYSYSTFGNPNFISSFILLSLPIGIVFLLLTKNKYAKIYYFIIDLLCAVTLAVTYARSSLLGVFCALFILFIFAPGRKILFKNKKIIFSFVGILLILFLCWPARKDEYNKSQDIYQATESFFSNPKNLTLNVSEKALKQSYHQRLMAWTCGIENFKQKPLLGNGWGSWQLKYAPCQGELVLKYPPLNNLMTQSNSAHNVLIEILSNSGALGLLCYLIFICLVFWGFRKYYKEEKNIENKLFYLAIFASCIGFFVDNLLNITFQYQPVALIFYFFIGVLATLKAKKINTKKSFLVLFSIFLTTIFIAFSFNEVKKFLTEYYSLKGYIHKDKKERLNLWEKAINTSQFSLETYWIYFKVVEYDKDFEKMEFLLNEILTYYPYYGEFWTMRANLRAFFNKPQEAMADLKVAIALYPYYTTSFDVLFKLLSNFKNMRTLENAHYIETLRLPLSYQSVYNLLRAQIYFENNSYEKAREILLSELQFNPYNPDVQKQLILTDEKLGIKKDPYLQKAQSLTSLRKQLISSEEINPNLVKKIKEEAAKEENLEAQMLLAQAYFKQKDYQNSRLILTELYKKYSDSVSLNFAFSSLEEKQGNKEEAKKYLQAILARDKENGLALSRMEKLK